MAYVILWRCVQPVTDVADADVTPDVVGTVGDVVGRRASERSVLMEVRGSVENSTTIDLPI